MIAFVTGTFINAGGIILGGLLALLWKKPLGEREQTTLKNALGALTVFFGLRLVWISLNGSFGQRAKQLGLVLLAMSLGKILGKLLRLQKLSNSVGQFASRKLAAGAGPDRLNVGFLVATGLFCVAPLSVLGPVQEGLSGFAPVLVIKAIMDGLTTMAFVSLFGWGAMLAVIPVLAWQLTITRVAASLEPILRQHSGSMTDAILTTDGLLIFCVALLILQLKSVRRIEVADYLPSLVLAPLLALWL